MKSGEYHESVMVREVIENLHINKGDKYIDATLGTGGHTEEIIKKGGKVLGIEADPEMLEIASKRLEKYKGACELALGNFVNIDLIAEKHGFESVSGILFDLGAANLHLTGKARGFSFNSPEAPLDMRLNMDLQGVKASDLLNVLREDQLKSMFAVTMDYGPSKWLAKRVVSAREISPYKSVGDFLKTCEGLRGKPGLNAATLPFLALRIAVNSELANLEEALPKARGLLKKGGKILAISFHSGEDRIVKEFGGGKPIYPSEEEVAKNPRARSARMRIIEKE